MWRNIDHIIDVIKEKDPVRKREKIKEHIIKPCLFAFSFLVIIAAIAAIFHVWGPIENFSGNHYKNFPDVPNIVSYLELDPDGVIIFSGEDSKSFINFWVPTWADNDDSDLTYTDYAYMLETMGYRMTQIGDEKYNGYELENGHYKTTIRVNDGTIECIVLKID
ncbi:MAG: hypothetical protein LBU77_01085 [Clostridiales bacterium]|jgi:hypothetical protein|nr:hypothetical protein [Clostridiales bacterium]